ncbi:hypothetical protein ACFQ1S_14550 [Kibdelosporangium lantanae]|uniref:Uncharacterized protein n=1 Tax=Kibdelosporangium lantanae TaxID=1497396 RepID=A0ABW3MAJ3_9PSEU
MPLDLHGCHFRQAQGRLFSFAQFPSLVTKESSYLSVAEAGFDPRFTSPREDCSNWAPFQMKLRSFAAKSTTIMAGTGCAAKAGLNWRTITTVHAEPVQ